MKMHYLTLMYSASPWNIYFVCYILLNSKNRLKCMQLTHVLII